MIDKIDNISKLFDFANSTVYKWKKENRPIFELIEKYFTDDDIEEFLETGKINKHEFIRNLSLEDLESISSLKEELIKKEIELHKQRIEELEIKLNNTGEVK